MDPNRMRAWQAVNKAGGFFLACLAWVVFLLLRHQLGLAWYYALGGALLAMLVAHLVMYGLSDTFFLKPRKKD